MTFQQHIDALQSALAQTRTDFGGPAICSVMAEDLRVALHLIGQAALVPSAGSADSVRVVAWRARDGHGLPQTTWIDGDPGPQMESAWVGGDIECAYAGPVAAQAQPGQSVLIEGTVYDVPAAVAGELLRLHIELRQAAQAPAAAGDALAITLPAKMPKHEGNGSEYPSSESYHEGYAEGWNDAIDAAIAAQQGKGGEA